MLGETVADKTAYTLASGYDVQTCHEACQEYTGFGEPELACQFFSISNDGNTGNAADGVCKLYTKGACTQTKGDAAVTGTDLYAKSNFYEDPF
jgi:hypothetical protein